MKPKRIVLVRHAQSVGNVDRNIYATVQDHKVPLTDLGRDQCLIVGTDLLELFRRESVHVYCSPYLRTRQTCEEITYPLNVTKIYEDPRLREQEFGNYFRLVTPEVRKERFEYGYFFYRVPGGESGADVHDRISTFLETMYRDFQQEDFSENVLIVTHGLTLRVFLMRFLHLTVEEFEELDNPYNCEHFVLNLQSDGKYKLENDLRKWKG